jgi:hypothetical protein
MDETGAQTMTPLRAAQLVTDGLGILCQADPAALDCATLGELLMVLEQAETMTEVARAGILGAFTAAQGYESDGHGGPVPWLMGQAQTTRARARAQVRSGKKAR